MKTNNLSAYNLACGYIQKYEVRTENNEYDLKLYRDSCFQVELTIWEVVPIHKGILGIDTDIDYPVKTTFTTDCLTDARKEYARLLSALKAIEKAEKLMDNFKTKCNETAI